MNKTIITLALLIASVSAFKVNGPSLASLGAFPSRMSTYTGRPEMPCATVVPDFYKAFQFISLKGDQPTILSIKNFNKEGDALLKY